MNRRLNISEQLTSSVSKCDKQIARMVSKGQGSIPRARLGRVNVLVTGH